MRNYCKAVLPAILLVIACISASASDETTALPFVRVNHDPVSAAMGGAGVVNASAYSSFRNTAAFSFYDKTFDVAAAYSYSKTQNISVGAGYNIGKVSVTVGGNYGIIDRYTIVNDAGVSVGTFNPTELQVNVGAAWKFLPFLSVGLNVKYLSTTLYTDNTRQGVDFDAFLQAKLSDFRIAAGVSSVGTQVKAAEGDKFSLPSSVTVGAGYCHAFNKHGINAVVDLDYYFLGDFTAAVGAEYSYKKLLFVRAGYHYAEDSAVLPSFVSFGLGVQVIGIRLDVSYQLSGSTSTLAKDTFNVGLGFSF